MKHPGIVLVLLGVTGEVVFDWKEMTGKTAWAKKLSAVLLVVGLALEISEAAKSDTEVAALTDKAAQAQKSAAEVNERATKFDLARVEMEKQVEEVRKVNLELRIKLQPRRITTEQRTQFIELVKDAPKSAVGIYAYARDMESREYRADFRRMLEEAGYRIVNQHSDEETELYGRLTPMHMKESVFLCVKPAPHDPKQFLQLPFMTALTNAFHRIGIEAPFIGLHLTPELTESNLLIIITEKK